MIPSMLVVGIRKNGRRGFRLWIPLFLIWLVLLPLVLVLLPLAFVVLLIVRVNPFRAFSGLWRVVAGLKGTHIEVDDGEAAVLVRIF